MSTDSVETIGAAEAGAAIVLRGEGGKDELYPMFELRDMLPTGAFLGGVLLLDVGDKVVLELSLGEETRVRADAVVTAVVEDEEEPGVMVSFSDVGDQERELIERWVAKKTDE